MKRYIFGLMAIVVAVTSVAFTNPVKKNKPLSYTFYFTGNPLTPGDVEDESKWSLTSPGNECAGAENKACRIVVDDDQTEMVNSVRVLKSSLSITAAAGAGGSGSGYIPTYPHTGISAKANRP